MKIFFNELLLSLLSDLGLSFRKTDYKFRDFGDTYVLNDTLGTGFVWIYSVKNLYTITVSDLILNENSSIDLSLKFNKNTIISIPTLNYNFISAKLESIISYDSHKKFYKENLKKNLPLRCIQISISHNFFKKHLQPLGINTFEELFNFNLSTKNNINVSEIILILKQIYLSTPLNIISEIFYENKIIEIILLFIQWSQNYSMFDKHKGIKDKDLENIRDLSNYLKANYSQNITLDSLTKMYFMSTNKLTSLFKEYYGLTITEYLQLLRITKAKELLVTSTLKIGEIANLVGYKQHSSFSELFKQVTGFTPNEYKKSVH
ncbi:MAG: helix-turn-helix transcriptional regulator [Clostridium sp.]|nr:helix-turn-helix transcriptional regulator [Clostridium sp.]